MRPVLYAAMSLVVAAPFLLDAYLRSNGNLTLWYLLACALVVVWASYPDYGSRWLDWPLRGATALVVANAVVSAGWALADGEPSPRLPSNVNVRFRSASGLLAADIPGDQIITTDSRGYRTNGPIDYARKPAGTLRIVAIGASTTEEGYLDDHRTWTNLLGDAVARATGRRVEVINTAVSGVRAEQNYRALLETEDLSPDLVTILIGINDWNFAVSRSTWSPFHRFAFRIRALGAGNSLLLRALGRLKERLSPWFREAGKGSPEELIVDDDSFTAPWINSLERPTKLAFQATRVDPEYAAWIDLMIDECKRRHLHCLFADQPTGYALSIAPDLRQRLWMTPPFADYTLRLEALVHLSGLYNGWLAEVTKRNGVAFCELARHIPPTREFLVDDCHFNEAGARRIAELMTPCALGALEQPTPK